MKVSMEKVMALAKEQGWTDCARFRQMSGLDCEECQDGMVCLSEIRGHVVATHLDMTPEALLERLREDDDKVVVLSQVG